MFLTQHNRSLQMRYGTMIPVQARVSLCDRQSDRGFHKRLVLKLSSNSGGSPVQRFFYCEVRVRIELIMFERNAIYLPKEVSLEKLVHCTGDVGVDCRCCLGLFLCCLSFSLI